MKRSSFLKFRLFAAVVIVLASALTANTQPPVLVVGLTSFDPASPVFNPTYPVPMTLRHTVVGSPTHYRFSRFSDFRDATWLPYVLAPIAQIPASWFQDMNPPARPNVQVVLHFQVRVTNPRAGRPVKPFSRITDPLTGRTKVKTEPRFLNSGIRSKTILVVFFG
jgi:hypothetical protein